MEKSVLFPAVLLGLVATGIFSSCENKTGGTEAVKTPANNGVGRIASGKTGSYNIDFVTAAKAATPAVVHIKTTYNNQSAYQDPFERLFGPPAPESVPAMGSGSGVIIAADGYIATNNHVIEGANSMEVIFPDRRAFPAKLVGRDPSTDLALLKVEASKLPALQMGNSDNVQVGEWVLAIGYPFSLNTTATAGIISAKGRSIGIINQSLRDDFSQGASQPTNTAIESFIQTDAAINPGNSGGALVNTNGELIGINTAIASLTGSYAGYSFAIPVNLAKKVLDDLKQFGVVKRAILGVAFPAPAAEDQFLKQMGINPGSVKGVFITDVQKGSAAEAAGLQQGDIIQSINDISLTSSAEFSERIARFRPGDKIELTYLRKGKENKATVTLKGEETAPPAANEEQALREIYEKLGAAFVPLTPALKERFNLRSGVVVSEIKRGGFFDQMGVPRGTIIGYVNGKAVNSPKDVNDALIAARNGRILMMAITPDGSRVIFNFSLGA